jgi:rod shape-determining protein MreD
MKKAFFFLIFLYFIALLETSFFVHFRFFNILPNLLLIFQILITLFEDPKGNWAFFSAILAGFFLDVFSERPIGFNIFALLFISFVLKTVLRKYVRIPALRRF